LSDQLFHNPRVDAVIGVINASTQLWPTLVEIAYFQKCRSGLAETLVASTTGQTLSKMVQE
jgi:hypothetical protein